MIRRRRYMLAGGTTAVWSLLSGCTTHLDAPRFDLNDASRSGVVHVLPYTFYKMDITWRIASCGDQPEIGVKVTAEAAEADDAAQAYVIDPTSLQTLLSIATFKVEYVEGQNRLKSISASVEDRTAPTIVNIASGGARIAAAGLGLAPPGASPGAAGPTTGCLPGIKEKIDLAKTRKGELEALTDQVDAANAEVVGIAARVVILGAAVDDKTKAEYAAAVQKLQGLQGLQAKATGQLAEALKPITFIMKHEWPTDSAEFSSAKALQPPLSALEQWIGPKPLDMTKVAGIWFQLERIGPFGRDPTVAAANGGGGVDPTSRGLRYRTPARGRLVVCRVSPCRSAFPANVVTALEGPVAQLGFVNVLPVRTRPFGSTVFSAEYGPSGGLKSAGYEQKAAPLEAASAAFNSVAESAAPLILANQPAQKLAPETAMLEALKKKRDAEAALAPATPAAPAPNQETLDALGADTTLLNAQISNYQARLTLADLATKLGQ